MVEQTSSGTRPGPIPKLMTFAPMIDSELSRLVLDHHDIAYQEVDHLFGWVSLLTLAHGGYGRIPILYGRGVHLTAPRPIAEHYDRNALPEKKLIPSSGSARAFMEKGWDLCNGQMAHDTAVVAYYHLLSQRELMIEVFSRRIPKLEVTLLPYVYGTLKGLFTLLLQLSADQARASLAKVRSQFAQTDAMLAHGAPFLDGERRTLADLALASAAAPLVMPDHYGAALPSFDQMPPELKAIIESLRGSRTARFVQDFYKSQTSPLL